MSTEGKEGKLVHQEINYTIFKEGQFYMVENVPARVDLETGEQFFSPKTVEQLHQIILRKNNPVRTIETSVYHFEYNNEISSS
jgi:hypothetical protein